ncbi:alkaline phosphatase [Aliicoccus persicus]|uniref:Alkaline phosphatase n=1 Tax=Aliicoccus persicus TaxID=930138 RepID=A0A662Z1U2_9STAP|nr:alkaline phosphatase [Aliicoccus persicus]SEV88406.1 alkaline phosphatase [Aliicoccus persicus]
MKKFVFATIATLLTTSHLMANSAFAQDEEDERLEEDRYLNDSIDIFAELDIELAEEDMPKNIIYLIGDGMGTTYNTAYRYYKHGGFEWDVELTEFDKHLVGQQMTHPYDGTEVITDSGASATAMAAGAKTYNNAIGVDHDHNTLVTVLEVSKANAKSTGIIATSTLTHATPASFGAHNESRHNHEEIADHFFDQRINGEMKIDVLLGAGLQYFDREDRNLVEEFEGEGYDFIQDLEGLESSENDKLLGLFYDDSFPKMWDREEGTVSLEDMTRKAIDTLDQNEEGFFLMVEGSQIDWAGHSNDVASAMSEMEDFENAFAAAIEFAEADGETLVVATADHNTGGFSLGVDGYYQWLAEPLHEMERTPEFLASEIVENGEIGETLSTYVGWEFTEEELSAVEEALTQPEDEQFFAVETVLKESVDVRTYTGWTTGGHTAEEVNVYAFGPGSELFRGLTDNHMHGFITSYFMGQDVTRDEVELEEAVNEEAEVEEAEVEEDVEVEEDTDVDSDVEEESEVEEDTEEEDTEEDVEEDDAA